MATFLELQTAVSGIIIDTPATTLAQIPTFIREAVRKLQTKHNFKVMEEETSVLVTATATRVLSATPSDFKEFRGLPYEIMADGTVRELMNPANRVAVLREYGDTRGGEADTEVMSGPPKAVLLSEPTDELGTTNLEVYPLPDGLSLYANTSAGQYRIVVPYWKYLTVLSANGDTNWFTVNADEYIKYQAASEGFFHDHDEERGTFWAQKAAQQWNDILLRDKYLKLSGVRELWPSGNAAGSRLRGPDPSIRTRRGL